MKTRARLALGFLAGLLLLGLFLRGTDWREVLAALKRADLGWLSVSQVMIWLSFFARAKRWGYVVHGTAPLSYGRLFTSVQIGQLANFTLPLRAGDLLQALALRRFTGQRASLCVAQVALDRISDLVGVLAVLFVAILSFQPDGPILIPRETFGTASPLEIPATVFRTSVVLMAAIFAGLAVVLALLFIYRERAQETGARLAGLFSARLARRVGEQIGHFTEGLRVLNSPRCILKSMLFSLLTWGIFVGGFVPLMLAFHLRVSWNAPFVLTGLLAAALSFPGTPGYVGQYHIPVVVGLVALDPGTPLATAKALALAAHFLNLAHVLLSGLVCLALERKALRGLHR
ncbi:MAG: flippase-like domain-containing protein, partial [Candidatus Omnitrophica bacterium]|nr:flippase-like domain-containing protein [Candidatus Omnitrophota bacterium]